MNNRFCGESPARNEAFDDTWYRSEDGADRALIEIKQSANREAAAMLDAMVGFLGKNAIAANPCMMGVRLTGLHRVLKPTGSLVLCNLNLDAANKPVPAVRNRHLLLKPQHEIHCWISPPEPRKSMGRGQLVADRASGPRLAQIRTGQGDRL